MKRSTVITSLLCCAVMPLAVAVAAWAQDPINPCLGCHAKETPKIVEQWEAGKHSMTGVKCYVCHHTGADDKGGMEHNGFFIAGAIQASTCESCHPGNGADLLAQFAKGGGKHP